MRLGESKPYASATQIVSRPTSSSSRTESAAARGSPAYASEVEIFMSVLRSAVVVRGSEPLDESRGPEPAAAAHGHQPDLAVAALELVQQRRDEPGPTRPQRVAEGDGAAVDVDAIPLGLELSLPGQHDR